MHLSRLSGLVAIEQAVRRAEGDLLAVMRAILDENSVMPHASGATIEIRRGDVLHCIAGSGSSRELVGWRIPVEGSLSGLCLTTGEPQRTGDWSNDSRVHTGAIRPRPPGSMIAIPIPRMGEINGVLKYHSDALAAFDCEDMLIAKLLVAPIAEGLSKVGEADAHRVTNELRGLLEIKQQLVSTVSHELRTPVTAMLGSLELLDSGAAGDLPEPARSLIAIVTRSAARLRRLLDDLMEMDKIESGTANFRRQPVDLGRFIGDVVEENRAFAAEQGVLLVTHLPPTRPITLSDPDRLAQVLINLLSNAVKFSPAGSTVSVTLEDCDRSARIHVADEGPGIPVEFRPRLFERFSQCDATRAVSKLPGAGLGLAIAHSLMELLNGTLELEEGVRTGATFVMNLPIELQPSVDALPAGDLAARHIARGIAAVSAH